MLAKENTVILLPALGIAHESQSGRLRTKILDDPHLFIHKVIHDLFRQGKILPQYVHPALRIYQTLSDQYDLSVFFAHDKLSFYSFLQSYAQCSFLTPHRLRPFSKCFAKIATVYFHLPTAEPTQLKK